MKCLFLTILFVFVSFLNAKVSIINNNNSSFSFEVDFGRFYKEKIKLAAGQQFISLNMDSSIIDDKQGMPQLPFRRFSIGVPQGPLNFSYKFQELATYKLKHKIIPVPSINGKTRSLSEYNYRTKYSLDKYPVLQIDTVFIKIKNQRILNLDICPFVYNVKNNTLTYYKKAVITVNYQKNGSYSKANGFENLLKNTLLNYQTAKFFRVTEKKLGLLKVMFQRISIPLYLIMFTN